MVQTYSTKYEKRMLKIWEKLDPTSEEKIETGLRHFVDEYHPSVVQMTERVNSDVLSILRSIELLDKEKRKQFIEEEVALSWQMFGRNEEDVYMAKEYCDNKICSGLYGIWVGGEDNCVEVDGKEIWGIKWSGKSSFLWDEKDLTKDWDFLWEMNQDDQHFGSNELKDWLWEKEDGWGWKRKLFARIKQAQSIIPNELKEDIESRVKRLNETVKEYAIAYEKLEDDEHIAPHFRHWEGRRTQSWDVQFVADDFWKDLDQIGIMKRLKYPDGGSGC